MADITDGPQGGGAVTSLVQEAMDRWARCNRWEAQARKLFLDDLKFAEADSDNGYQWPNSVRRNRDVDERPCLTINKTRQHNLHILNKMIENKQAIKFVPTGNGATSESALVYACWARQVEYQSNAQVAYGTAAKFMVKAGIGWVRVKTEYEDPRTNYQVPRIVPVNDPLTVFCDPEAVLPDKSDGKFLFVFDDKNKEEFIKQNPQWRQYATAATIGDTQGWMTDDRIRICEYFRKVEKPFQLFSVKSAGQQGQPPQVKFYDSRDLKDSPDVLQGLRDQSREDGSGVEMRESADTVVEYHYIIGVHEVLSEATTIPGKFIPLAPMIAEETIIQGIMDRKGHTRALKDAQRTYNYWTSVAVEYGALQTKTPWIAPAEAIEDYEVYWNNANKVNNAILPYNALADDGTTVIPPPQRISPPVSAPVAIDGMKTASVEMQMVSGQYDNSMAAPGNERTGAAIDARGEQGETATSHYQDAQAQCIRHVGQIIMSMAPVLMDTQRMVQCMAESGASFEVSIDPQQQQALALRASHMGQVAAMALWNPSVGRYDVQADVGPAYGTRRKQTVETLGLILTQAPQLTGIIGDIMIKNMDIAEANEAAERLRRMVPPQALGTGPSPAEQQMQVEIQKLQQLLQQQMEENAHTNIKLRGKDARRNVESYNAVTTRLRTLLDVAAKKGEAGGAIPMSDIHAMLDEVMSEASSLPLEEVLSADEPSLRAAAVAGGAGANGASIPQTSDQPPIPGAKRGADGHWYVRHMSESKAYDRVT